MLEYPPETSQLRDFSRRRHASLHRCIRRYLPRVRSHLQSAVGNRYVGTTVCAVFANQTVVQQEVDITRSVGKTSISGTIWNSTGTTPSTWFNSYAYETDIDLNVARRIGKYDASIGGWMFLLEPGAKTNVPVLDMKIARSLSRGHNIFTPFTETQWYGTTNGKAAGYYGGVYPMLGMAYERSLAERISFSSRFHTNYDAMGGFGKSAGKLVFSADAGLRISMTGSSALSAHGGLVGAYHDPARGAYTGRPRIPVFSIGISKSF